MSEVPFDFYLINLFQTVLDLSLIHILDVYKRQVLLRDKSGGSDLEPVEYRSECGDLPERRTVSCKIGSGLAYRQGTR